VGRSLLVEEEAKRIGTSGEPFVPGLLKKTSFSGDLKSLAKKLEPAAEQIRQSPKKGKGHGDDQED